MNWIPLQSESQLQEIILKSKDNPQVIFKHSTRCGVSSMIKNRLEKSEQPENLEFHYLDLIKFRNLSNQISRDFNIRHESPQVIVVKDGKPVYEENHSAIYMDDIVENLSTAKG